MSDGICDHQITMKRLPSKTVQTGVDSLKVLAGIVAVLLMFFTAELHAGEVLLVDAVEAKNSEQIAKILSNDVDVNAAQVDGMTALHWAAPYDASRNHTSCNTLLSVSGCLPRPR